MTLYQKQLHALTELSNNSILEKFGQYQKNLVNIRKIWTILEKFGQYQKNLVNLIHFWTE